MEGYKSKEAKHEGKRREPRGVMELTLHRISFKSLR